MQMFGIISLLVTLALGMWWIGNTVDSTVDTDSTKPSYGEAIDSAHEATEKLGGVYMDSKAIEIYDGIKVPEYIAKVDLSGKRLEGSLKAEIRHLRKVRELDISNNNFTGLPAEVGQLSNLEVLNLSNNPFTGLPHELGNLKNLKTLDLRGTQYSEFDLNIISESLPSDVNILVD